MWYTCRGRHRRCSAGQLDRQNNTIYRDTGHVWGLSCSLLASQVFRDAVTQAGGTPTLLATSGLNAPGMVRPLLCCPLHS